MTLLITGGAGYIGGHMLIDLVENCEDFIVVDNMSNGVTWAIPEGVKLYIADTGDYQEMRRIIYEHKVDTVIHFAATLIMPELYQRPLEYYRINSANGRALLQACADGGVNKFIYSATSAVYGNPASNPVSETALIAPTTPYGKSKLVTELMLQDLANISDMRFVALRYFNVAGADPLARYGQSTNKTTLLVQIAVQCALGIRNGLSIFGTDYPTPDGTCIRDYLHVTDLVDAHVKALQHLRSGGDSLTLNVGYGHGYSVRDIIDTVRDVTGRDFNVTEGARRLGDPTAVVAEANLIREKLGWAPQLDNIRLIVEHALNWELKMEARRKLYMY